MVTRGDFLHHCRGTDLSFFIRDGCRNNHSLLRWFTTQVYLRVSYAAQCNFVTASDFVKTIRQSLEQYYTLTDFFVHRVTKEKPTRKNCTEKRSTRARRAGKPGMRSLHAWGRGITGVVTRGGRVGMEWIS